MQCMLIWMMRFLNVSSLTVMPHRDLSFSRTDSLNRVGDIPKKCINASRINNDVKQFIARCQRAYDAKKGNNADETSAEYFTSRRLLKRAVKQAKRNNKINVARLCKNNPKGFYSYINERRIIRDDVGPLKTPTSQIVTMHWQWHGPHTQHIHQLSVHPGTTEQHSTTPKICGQHIDTFNFRLEDVQEKIIHHNLYKSTGPDLLHPRVLWTLEDMLCGALTTCII